MAEELKLVEESVHYKDFRAPQFTVKVEGVGLPSNILRDVYQVVYKDNIKEIDGFELLVNNWDADIRKMKYVGTETSVAGASAQQKMFEPANKKFEVSMGYSGALTSMVRGTCTTMEPSFTNSGVSMLNVRGLNVLNKLRTKQYTDKYPNRKPSQIALDIKDKNDPETHKKRFPIPIEINQTAMGRETELEYTSQKNQYDIDFLFQLARKVGYVVYIQEDAGNSRLYFGPSNSDAAQPLRQVTYKLKWGVSLIDFKPTMNAANQVRSVSVRGTDSHTHAAINETISLSDSRIRINRDLVPILQAAVDERADIVVREPVRSAAEARQRALAVLMERFQDFVTASGTTIGLPDLRAGMLVKIDGVGARFNGTYFVTESTHTINDSGYLTKFSARREDTGS